MKSLASLFMIVCGSATLSQAVSAQMRSIADSSAQALREVRRSIERDRRSADSLRSIWDRQWRVSDSLRIESMLVRMRSDSLRRAVAAGERRELELLQALTQIDTNKSRDTILQTPDVAALPAAETTALKIDRDLVERAVRSSRKGPVSAGRTLSDTITARVLAVDPDSGIASYYADAFHGRRTSSGEIFNMHDRTCAHRWLPFNTKLLVTNLANGREVVVRVTDRGPWKRTRIIDLSKQAAVDLDMIRAGTARVRIQVYQGEDQQPAAPESAGGE